MSDTPGGMPRVEDQLGCGPGQTVSDMEMALDQRLVELRAPQGRSALRINANLLLAARDIALMEQGGVAFDQSTLKEHLAKFGYRGEDQAIIWLTGSIGLPTAPADPSVLVTGLPADDPRRSILSAANWVEGAATPFGSCYELGAVVLLGQRKAAPGPNP